MTRLSLLLLVAVGILASASAPEVQTIQGWGIAADPDGDCRFLDSTPKDGKLAIAIPGTYHDFFPVKGKVNGPRVLQNVEGDFVVEVRVAAGITPDKGTELPGKDLSFRAGTLLLWQDSGNFIRLDRAGMIKQGKAVAFVYYHVFQKGQRTLETGPVCKEEATLLRIERKGNKILASWKQGRTSKKLPEQTLELPAKVQVGVGAINSSTQPLRVEFDEFKLTLAKKKN
jgi:regulation of enolase protein 1 (concanavalin A-like superfamily)